MEIGLSGFFASEVGGGINRPAEGVLRNEGIDKKAAGVEKKGSTTKDADVVVLSSDIDQPIEDSVDQCLACFLSDAKNILTGVFIAQAEGEDFSSAVDSKVTSGASTKEPYGLTSSQLEMLKSI